MKTLLRPPAPAPRNSARRAGWLLALAATAVATAQDIAPTTGIDFPVLGQVRPRHAREIASSPWSIGGETLDRNFATYAHYARYLGPLGAKRIRLQAGWAKCEPAPGTYAWEWLDAVVADAVSQGVKPWLELSYGNPAYPGGGDTGLGGGFPSSPEALAAWDRWARALVARYRDRVDEWEIWNEPDLNRTGTASVEAYVDLFIRTATSIRELQPAARIWALGLAGKVEYAAGFLAGVQARGQLALVDAITFHGYPKNPDDTALADRLAELVARHGGRIGLRQGETGAPSQYQENFALARITWSETTQAKWDLRRLLAHHAKDVPVNLFTLSDLHYTQASGQQTSDGVVRMNYKGLLATNPDQTVARAKPAYVAAQCLFALCDDTLRRLRDFRPTHTALRAPAITGYRDAAGRAFVALWFSDAPPADANGVTPADVTLPGIKFTAPVLVDLRTATVYEIPAGRRSFADNATTLRALPLYDSPVVVAERAAVPLAPAAP